jgi:hypothetical protein
MVFWHHLDTLEVEARLAEGEWLKNAGISSVD